MKIYMGIGGLEFVSGVTRFPGLFLSFPYRQYHVFFWIFFWDSQTLLAKWPNAGISVVCGCAAKARSAKLQGMKGKVGRERKGVGVGRGQGKAGN